MDSNRAAVCTLFEGDYHYGVGALVNSLYAAGFRGSLWAGYKGDLPPWAIVDANGVMQVSDGLEIHFVRLATDWHLTNYKPTFMRELWEKEGANWSALFYFDPDIVVKAKWQEFEFWTENGVAVVEDVMNGRVGPTHPLRARWKAFAAKLGVSVVRSGEAFCNGGFLGIQRRDRLFLELWEGLLAGIFIHYEINPKKFMCEGRYTRAFPFIGTDQDTLNLALMSYGGNISMAGPEGMDFQYGGYFMSHAIASPKPWRRGTVRMALGGVSPTMAVKNYWRHVDAPICLYNSHTVRFAKVRLTLATLIGRFYRRS